MNNVWLIYELTVEKAMFSKITHPTYMYINKLTIKQLTIKFLVCNMWRK